MQAQAFACKARTAQDAQTQHEFRNTRRRVGQTCMLESATEDRGISIRMLGTDLEMHSGETGQYAQTPSCETRQEASAQAQPQARTRAHACTHTHIIAKASTLSSLPDPTRAPAHTRSKTITQLLTREYTGQQRCAHWSNQEGSNTSCIEIAALST